MAKDPIELAALASEMADSNFDDERLNKRLKGIVTGLGKDPSVSLPCSFDSAGLEGAYRFFSNQRVTPDAVLANHYAATRARCEAAGNDILIVHDTTTFSYRFDGEREGLGHIQRSNKNSNQVFFAHVSLALAANGTRRPLGIAGLETWTRGPTPTGIEYQRWEEQMRASSAQLDAHKSAVHLADREADDYEMFFALQRDEHRYVVRCQHNRWLEDASGNVKLHELFARIPTSVEREVPLSRRKPRRTDILRKTYPARHARLAKLCVAAATVAIKKPRSPRKDSVDPPDSLLVNVVRVWEPNPPADVEPVEWYLYSSEPIETTDQLLTIVDYYRARWTIEVFFKVLKTGCSFQKRQLQDYEALTNLLAVFLPIAYRLLLISSEASRAPDEPQTELLSSDHLDVLRTLGRIRLPPLPTNRQIYLAIAALGGHIKYSGDPGWLTLQRGYEKLGTFTEGWSAAKLQLSSDQG
jgi:transposase-like protein/DDE family transposase